MKFLTLNRPAEAEAETGKDMIWPILEVIGWADMSVQQNLLVKAREDVPDALLFESAETKASALEPWKRFQHGRCVVEAERWNRLLDREEAQRGRGGRALDADAALPAAASTT